MARFKGSSFATMFHQTLFMTTLSSFFFTSALVQPRISIHHSNREGSSSMETCVRQRPFSSSAGNCLSSKYEYDYDDLMKSPGEASRFNRGDVMNHERWLRHRSSDRFFRSLSTVSESAILKSLYDEVGLVTLACISAILWNEIFIDGYDDFGNIHHTAPLGEWDIPVLKLPTLPFELSSGVLGLLLVFRANNTYDRWLRANANWVAIVSLCQSIITTAVAADHIPNVLTNQQQQDRYKSTQMLSVFISAFPRLLRKHLQQKFDPDSQFESDMMCLMKDYPKQCESLLKARNPPFRATYDLQKAVSRLRHLDESTKVSLSEKIDKLSASSAECESIYTTPVPRPYTRHTTRFLTIYLLLLPLALYDTLGCNWNHLGAVFASALISFLFFGVEEIAVFLEEPFTIMPLDKFTDDVRLSVEEAMEWMEEDEFLQSEYEIEKNDEKVTSLNVFSFSSQNSDVNITEKRE
mmetsp:Transcript_63130/g.93671  ORF Transcript_63130/g.93671 Transcript_63130/m.93671 type:complete len:466 (+) Transcript_63130:135-1532(+)